MESFCRSRMPLYVQGTQSELPDEANLLNDVFAAVGSAAAFPGMAHALSFATIVFTFAASRVRMVGHNALCLGVYFFIWNLEFSCALVDGAHKPLWGTIASKRTMCDNINSTRAYYRESCPASTASGEEVLNSIFTLLCVYQCYTLYGAWLVERVRQSYGSLVQCFSVSMERVYSFCWRPIDFIFGKLEVLHLKLRGRAVAYRPAVALQATGTGVDADGPFLEALMDGRKVKVSMSVNDMNCFASSALFVRNSAERNLFATNERVVNEAALKVSPEPREGPLAKGSCVIVSNERFVGCGFRYGDYLITAAHVYTTYIECVEQIWLTIDGKYSLPVKARRLPFKFPDVMDVAVLDVGNTVFSALGLKTVSLAYPMVGSSFLTAISNETGCPIQCFGYLNRNPEAPAMLHHTSYTQPGFSGSAVYQNKSVVAMHLRYDKEADRNVCVSLRELKRTLDSNVEESYNEGTAQADVDRDFEEQMEDVDKAIKVARHDPSSFPGAMQFLDEYRDALLKSRFEAGQDAIDEMRELIDRVNEGDPLVTHRMVERNGVLVQKGQARVGKKKAKYGFEAYVESDSDIKGSPPPSLSMSGFLQDAPQLSSLMGLDSATLAGALPSGPENKPQRVEQLTSSSDMPKKSEKPVIPPRPSPELLNKLKISVTPKEEPRLSSDLSSTKPHAISRSARRKALRKALAARARSTQDQKPPADFAV
jgi:hypothetical protein